MRDRRWDRYTETDACQLLSPASPRFFLRLCAELLISLIPGPPPRGDWGATRTGFPDVFLSICGSERRLFSTLAAAAAVTHPQTRTQSCTSGITSCTERHGVKHGLLAQASLFCENLYTQHIVRIGAGMRNLAHICAVQCHSRGPSSPPRAYFMFI
ncbi:hypothetical protein GOODEAATRI_000198 [Goodea atripinnis]|uniref:Uncharacterized protein n=1 Tax=Goodea atripinnis TaxID=208336 RepID=A0ABV0P221_9TELE